MHDLTVGVSDGEPGISPVRRSSLLVLAPSLNLRQLHRALGRTVLDSDDFTAAVVDEGEVDLEHAYSIGIRKGQGKLI